METNAPVSEQRREELLLALSKLVTETIGKPERYVMVSLVQSAGILMSARVGAAAFIEVRSIGGLSESVNAQMSKSICNLLKDALGVAPERVYINFREVTASNWGWNGETFG